MSAWITLPHLTGVKLRGPDALAFAHAQFTTAFAQDRAPLWQLSAWCTPKGKVLSVMLARSRAAEVDLIVPATQRELLATRLPMFAIGRKVEVLTGLPVAGRFEPGSEPACMLGPDRRRSIELDAAGALPGQPEASARWTALDICAGIAWLPPARSEQFLPQALGLEERDGLSYRKGCYPGQEVIARVHYLGRLKEHLVGFRLAGPVDADDPDLSDENGQRLGRILTSTPWRQATIGLAVVESRALPGLEIVCGDQPGRLSEPSELC